MSESPTRPNECVVRWTLVLGVLQVLVGCVVGLTPPDAVQWFRGIVMAHIEFTANGVLMIALGFLLREMTLGVWLTRVWFVALQFGTWCNGLAGVVGAWVGASSPLLPTLNAKFPPPHGASHLAVTGLLQLCGATIVLALVLTLLGLLRPRQRAAEN